jgi:hypothetical protein
LRLDSDLKLKIDINMIRAASNDRLFYFQKSTAAIASAISRVPTRFAPVSFALKMSPVWRHGFNRALHGAFNRRRR